MKRANKLAMLQSQAPELSDILKDLKAKVEELNTKITPLRKLVEECLASQPNRDEADDLLQYLEAKQQLLMSYNVNITFYLYLKTQGESAKDHPVMKRLLELRYVMEKMRPLDGTCPLSRDIHVDEYFYIQVVMYAKWWRHE
jgi:U3 small nucleolar RNA-associated protein 3